MSISQERVHQIFLACKNDVKDLPEKDEEIINLFHEEKLALYREEIGKLLNELPEVFMEEYGGCPFYGAAVDKNGNLWGGQQDACELMYLGIAAGKAQFAFTNSIKSRMPYFFVKNQ